MTAAENKRKADPTGNNESESNVPNEMLFNKTAEAKADAVSAFINTAGLTGGRATFMAGFTYYSIGRYMFSCCESKAYFAFNIAALVLSIITAGTCQIFVYYAQRLTDPELQYEFCIQAIHYNRFLSRTNSMANLFYTIGIGLLPWAYYQQSDMKWCPLILMVIIAIGYYPFMFKIVLSQLSLQQYCPISGVAVIDDEKLVAESIFGCPQRIESLQDFLLKQSNIVAGRAIFISGLAQQGIMRFMPEPVVFSSDDHAANSFLVFVSFAMALSYLSGNVFLLLQVFIPDTIKEKQLPFAILIKPIANILFACYVSGFVALFLANIFVADGCNFEEMRRITVSFGFVGLGMMVVSIVQSAAASDAEKEYEVARETIIAKTGQNIDPPDEATTKKQEQHLQNIFLALNTAGSMSTFAAGYLYYNIVTYESDVLRLSGNDEDDWVVKGNLIANMTTVTFALYASVADTVLSLNANHYNTVASKLHYIESRMWIVQSVIYGYYFSLVGWFACFAFFGFVKFGRVSYVPLVYAIVGVIVMVIGTLYVHHARKSVDVENPRVNSSKFLTTEEVAVSISRPANLTSLGFSVIFLGGFSYFAVNFFFFNDRPHEMVYLHAMCLCYTTSMWVMVFGDRYNYQINKCPTVACKLAFAEKTYPFYCFTIFLAYAVVISLLVGFNFLGYVKFIENWEDVYRDIQMSTTVVALFCVPMVYWIATTFKKAFFIKDLTKEKNPVSPSEISRFKSQIIAGLTTSGFISGNVCYEILFAEAKSDYSFLNHYYFFSMSFAFACGVSAIVMSTLILLCLGELGTHEQKSFFVFTLRRAKLVVFICSLSCIICWQASILALSAVKYSGDKGGDLQSFIPGLFGLIVLLRFYFKVKHISDGIMVNGRTWTGPAVVDSEEDEEKNSTQLQEGNGDGKAARTTLVNDTSTILNPLVIEKVSEAPPSYAGIVDENDTL